MRNVWGLLVVIGLVALAAILILPFLARPRSRPAKGCYRNLKQIVQACETYQGSNGDYFPAFWDGERFDPMKSLAMLYPAYIDNAKVFGCPETRDRPEITVTEVNEKDKRCEFGPVDSNKKCSYFYDELSNPRDIGPGLAMACDADGQTWRNYNGKLPRYPADWSRKPRTPNHVGGQNVMYFDGHLRWADQPYFSRDPADNIFCPQAGWDADTDAYLWDGVNAREAE